MGRTDQRGELAAEPFSYRALKNGTVLLEHSGRTVKVLSSDAGRRFLASIEGASSLEAQLAMAKLTGNFKRGNERARRGS